MLGVSTTAECWEPSNIDFGVTQVTRVMMNTGVFPGKMCSNRQKNHGCAQKRPEGTSSAMFVVWTTAESYKVKRYLL